VHPRDGRTDYDRHALGFKRRAHLVPGERLFAEQQPRRDLNNAHLLAAEPTVRLCRLYADRPAA
jgi:hypothetical protein